jgi:Arc/MetJ-type ribon-helix-helix transcriptional regulator
MRFDGIHEKILKRLVESGVVKTKSEAIRNALLEYGLKFGAVDDMRLVRAMRDEFSRNPMSVDEILRSIEDAKAESVH